MTEAAVRIESIVSSKLLITSMDCPDCAVKVEKIVKRMHGVTNATVVYPAGRLNIEYDSKKNQYYSNNRQD
jgi:copper chaperone CopZ